MKLSQSEILSLANLQSQFSELYKSPAVAGIDVYKVTLSFKSFIETFANYTVSKTESEKLPWKLSTVCCSTLFVTLATEEEFKILKEEVH